MDRGDLAAYLSAQFTPLAIAATPPGATWSYDPPIDEVYGLLGVDESTWYTSGTVVPSGLESDARVLGRYFTLRLLALWVAPQVDVRTEDQASQYSQLSKNLQALLAEAKDQVPSIYPIDPGDFTFGRLQLDFLEPGYGYAGSPFFPYS